MADTGAPWNLPYPLPTDLVRDGADAIKDLAEAVSDSLGVVAYKFAIKNDVQSSSLASNATADVSGLSITHSVGDPASRVIVRSFVNVGSSVQRPRVALIAYDGTVVADSLGGAEGTRTRFTLTGGMGSGNPERMMATGQGFAVITPGDTSPHTYNVKILNAAGATVTIYVNRSDADANSLDGGGRGASYIELWEVRV
jgi:hypothetical protein